MIKTIFKRIWTERKINTWIVFELILVFCILWFCVDYAYFVVKRYFEPIGFNIEHVYQISIGKNGNANKGGQATDIFNEDEKVDIWTVFDRIKQHPDVEYEAISFSSMPYAYSYSGGSFYMDTIAQSMRLKWVTPEYFDVYKIKIEQGKAFTWQDAVADNVAVISSGRDDKVFQKPIGEVMEFYQGQKGDTPHPDRLIKAIGIAERSKKDDYSDYENTIYFPLKKDDGRFGTGQITVRVKPNADNDFAKRFTKDMQEKLGIGDFYLSSVVPLSTLKRSYIMNKDDDKNLKSVYSVSAFLLINIFLAVVGTFWFRIQARRSEIGLRMALGSSRRKVKTLFIIETLLLIFTASIVATLLAINVSLADILKEMDIPIIERGDAELRVQYFINYILTFLILAVIAIAGIWYPARKASRIQPAEALHEE